MMIVKYIIILLALTLVACGRGNGGGSTPAALAEVLDGPINLSSYQTVTAEKCDGSIDVINGISPPPAQLSTSGLLKMTGWVAISVDKGTLPEAVFMVLSDDKGNHKFFKTRSTSRSDVGAHFKKPELGNSGYISNVNVSALTGTHILGLAVQQSGKIEICPQFKIPVTINKV